ncbi:hypothetical protein [Amycolatopsis sp. lyj-109]|uniref:hypothetical protein n=1 Tax=Amycolatopsis sp. lyj-109 TaxID=2789287 RepID=UPI00397D8CDF
MPDSTYDGQLVGVYNSSAPAFLAGQYKSYGDLAKAVADLIYTADKGGGVEAGLSSNKGAEAWYVLGLAIADATKRLGEINTQFAAEIKAMKDHLTGDAGDAFAKYATDLLNRSEEVFTTLDGKAYGTTVGNVGHAVQAYAAAWWDLVQKYDDHRAGQERRIKDQGIAGIKSLADLSNDLYASDMQNLINKIADATAGEITKLDAKVKDDLLRDLQNLTTGLANQYNARGQDMVPIRIIGEKPKESSGAGRGKSGDGKDSGHGKDSGDGKDSGHSKDSGDGKGSGHGKDSGDSKDSGSGNDSGDSKDSGDGKDSGSGSGGAADVGNAVDKALGKIKGGGDSGSGSSGGTGNDGKSGQETPQMQKLLPMTDAQKKAGEAAAQAGQQAADAIKGLSGGATPDEAGATGGTPGTESAGSGASPTQSSGPVPVSGKAPGGQDLAAKQAADKAKKALAGIAGLDDPEAGDGASGGGGAAPGAGGGSLDTPEAKKALSDAHDATGKALDDLIGKTDDPAAKQALEHAKDAAKQAIDGLSGLGDGDGKPGDGSPGQDGAPSTTSDGPGQGKDGKVALDRQPALDDAQKQKVHEAQTAVDKALDDLIGNCDDPSRHNALELAKSAADEALTNLVDPAHAERDHEALLPMSAQDFLTPESARVDAFPAHAGVDADKLGALTAVTPGGGPGGGGTGISGLDGLTATEAGGGGAGAAASVPAQFDTDTSASMQRGGGVPFQQGTTTPGVQTSLGAVTPGQAGAMGSGMPMGGMGGMGGMGAAGGDQNKEREPQVWLQAGNSAWDDDESGTPPSQVLGRS